MVTGNSSSDEPISLEQEVNGRSSTSNGQTYVQEKSRQEGRELMSELIGELGTDLDLPGQTYSPNNVRQRAREAKEAYAAVIHDEFVFSSNPFVNSMYRALAYMGLTTAQKVHGKKGEQIQRDIGGRYDTLADRITDLREAYQHQKNDLEKKRLKAHKLRRLLKSELEFLADEQAQLGNRYSQEQVGADTPENEDATLELMGRSYSIGEYKERLDDYLATVNVGIAKMDRAIEVTEMNIEKATYAKRSVAMDKLNTVNSGEVLAGHDPRMHELMDLFDQVKAEGEQVIGEYVKNAGVLQKAEEQHARHDGFALISPRSRHGNGNYTAIPPEWERRKAEQRKLYEELDEKVEQSSQQARERVYLNHR